MVKGKCALCPMGGAGDALGGYKVQYAPTLLCTHVQNNLSILGSFADDEWAVEFPSSLSFTSYQHN